MYKRFEDDYTLPIYSLTANEFQSIAERLGTKKTYDENAIKAARVPASIEAVDPTTDDPIDYYDIHDLISDVDLIGSYDVPKFRMFMEELFKSDFSHDNVILFVKDDNRLQGKWPGKEKKKIGMMDINILYDIHYYGEVESTGDHINAYVSCDDFARAIEYAKPGTFDSIIEVSSKYNLSNGEYLISVDDIMAASYEKFSNQLDMVDNAIQFVLLSDTLRFAETIYILCKMSHDPSLRYGDFLV